MARPQFTMRLTGNDADDLDRVVAQHGFTKRSEFIRFAIQLGLEGQLQQPDPQIAQPQPDPP